MEQERVLALINKDLEFTVKISRYTDGQISAKSSFLNACGFGDCYGEARST